MTRTLTYLPWYAGQHVHVRPGRADGFEATIVATDQNVACVQRDDTGTRTIEACVDLKREAGRPPKTSNVLAFPGGIRDTPHPAAEPETSI